MESYFNYMAEIVINFVLNKIFYQILNFSIRLASFSIDSSDEGQGYNQPSANRHGLR